jgi:sigma-E factor negative regulatory protein RseA
MPHTKPVSNEDVSALMDDAIKSGEAHAVLNHVLSADDAKASWHRYQIIGDMIRSDAVAPRAGEVDFSKRVMDALACESASRPIAADSANVSSPAMVQKRTSANDSGFRIKAVAGALGVCLFALLVVVLLQEKQSGSASPQSVAVDKPNEKVGAELALEEERPVMNRNPELDALLSAHQQAGGHSALQTPSGFLRNATFDRSKQ